MKAIIKILLKDFLILTFCKSIILDPFQVGVVRRDVVARRQAGDFSEARIAADSRKSCDFSPSPKRYQPLPPSAARMPLAPTKSAAGVSYSPSGGGSGRQLQMLPYPPTNNPLQPTHGHGGLGRRAVTQLDFGRTRNNFDRVMPAAAAQPRLMQQQHYHHGGSQYLYKRGAAAVTNGEGMFPGPYSSDSEFTAQRAPRRPHVLLHKEQPVLTRIRRPSQVRERVELNLN